MPEYVLRLPLEEEASAAGDSSAATVLVNVRAPEKEGSNLIIEGTEGETPYVATFSPQELAAARSSSSPIPASAWTETLIHLLQYGPPPPLPEPAPFLSLTAGLEPSTSLTLHLRQTVAGGISQRLGALKLRADPDHEIDTLAWTATAVARSVRLTTERDAAAHRVAQAERRAQTLSDQLDELVTARKDSEDAMVVAFADLLNEKKRKVRELQRCVEELRLTDTANTNEQADAETKKESNTQGGSTSRRKAASSRRGKRKATDADPAAAEPAEADGGGAVEDDDEMDVHVEEEDHASDGSSGGEFEHMRSPGAERDNNESTDDAGSGDDDEGGGEASRKEASQQPPPPPPKRGVGKIGGQGAKNVRMPAAKDGDGKDDTGKAVSTTAAAAENAEVPPRRELPFTRHRKLEQREEDPEKGAETSDDEL